MRSLFDSPATACKQIKSFRAVAPGSMYCKAHDQRKADTCRWYLIPVNEWPSYAHAKLFSDWDPDNEGFVRLGAVVEKGLGSSAAMEMKRPAGQALIMKRSWRWREIIANDDSEVFIESVVTAAATSPGPMMLKVDAGILEKGMGADAYDPKRSWDRLVFQVDPSGDVELITSTFEADQLQKLKQAKNIDEVAEHLRKFSGEDWLWLDVAPFMRIQVAGQDSQSAELITTHELWESLLAPFENWLYQ